MAKNSKIQWTDATWNVAIGCTKVSEGCKFCYMMRDWGEGSRFGSSRKDESGQQIPVNGTVTRTSPATFNKPLTWQRQGLKAADGSPLKVFTSSLTDVFHPQIDPYRHEVWDIIRQCPDLVFQILTKRPERIAESLPADWGVEGYPNVWIGATIENQKAMDRLAFFDLFPAAVKFVSFEPLIGRIDLSDSIWCWRSIHDPTKTETDNRCPVAEKAANFDWAIIGGESGNETGKWTYRPCELNWIRGLHNELTALGVPVFVKQTGTYLAHRLRTEEGIDIDRHGGHIGALPDDFKFLHTRKFPNFENQ